MVLGLPWSSLDMVTRLHLRMLCTTTVSMKPAPIEMWLETPPSALQWPCLAVSIEVIRTVKGSRLSLLLLLLLAVA